MARPYILPLGFIRHVTEGGVIFTLSNVQDSDNLRRDIPVTVWRYSPEHLAIAKTRGIISSVGYWTATFKTVESAIDARWPNEEEILRERTPVYLALEDTFEPDPRRMLTQEQANKMESFGPRYRKLKSGDPQGEERNQAVDKEQ